MKFATKAIHAGQNPDPNTGAIITPIFQTSTYVQDGPGGHKGYEYARTQNPTRTALQDCIAALENGKFGLCFSSGMAATDAILKRLKPGDEVIATNDLYGGTYRIFNQVFARYDIGFHFADLSDLSAIEALINPKTKLLWIETPTNPMLSVVDLKKIAALAQSYKIKLCVDNTFASPYLQQPLDLGADMVCHSATKYLAGHSDVVHGAIVTNDKRLADDLRFIQNACGAVPGPQDCFLVLRGIKTLHLRMDAHCKNAKAIAAYLQLHKKVAAVHYPGLKEHPQHLIAKKQMKGFGGMVSFSLRRDNMTAATLLMKNTRLFSCAESLGGVESLIGHPASMTHASIPYEERIKTGVVDSLIRLSVGVEDVDDLILDLDKALSKVR